LTAMVQQNTKRLEKIVDDVLNLSRLPKATAGEGQPGLSLGPVLERVTRDWSQQNHRPVQTEPPKEELAIQFDAEHLRRVLVNLLDNALRYAGNQVDSIQVGAERAGPKHVAFWVWSNGAPLDSSVEQHLFEPFFSSESRTSGLGLYICRELCASHGAQITYHRSQRQVGDGAVIGNGFWVHASAGVLA
jgi:two-component system, NtrC family, sensor histidine kinase PilS